MGPILGAAARAALAALSAGSVAVIRRRTNQVARAALELGLQYDGERDVLKGRRAGVSVGAGAAPVVRQLEAELGLRREDALSRSVFRVAAALDPPLDLGLKVEGRGFFSLHEDIFATDHDFEHRYATHVDDPARARALLGPELRRRLVTVAGIWKAWLVDGGVLLESASRPNAAERANYRKFETSLDEEQQRGLRSAFHKRA